MRWKLFLMPHSSRRFTMRQPKSVGRVVVVANSKVTSQLVIAPSTHCRQFIETDRQRREVVCISSIATFFDPTIAARRKRAIHH